MQSSSGISLIELMVTIAIVAILAALAAPSFTSITNSSRIAGEVNGLLGDFQFARIEAIKEGQFVSVCASSDGSTCTGQTDWKSGWIVFSDPNDNGVVDAGETLFRKQKPFTGTDTFVATNNVSVVTFNREGISQGLANGTMLQLHTSANNSNWTRCLSVTLVGLMTTMKYNDVANGFTCT